MFFVELRYRSPLIIKSNKLRLVIATYISQTKSCYFSFEERNFFSRIIFRSSRWGEKLKTKNLSLTTIFAALYATLVIILGPVSYGPIQLRIADSLIPLAMIFGWPAVLGVSLGCLVGNTYYWLGTLDIILGPAANLIAASTIMLLHRRPFLACLTSSLIIGLVVGGYLWTFFPPPEIFGLSLPAWAGMVVSITLSSLVAVAGIGYILFQTLNRTAYKSRQP